MIYGLLIGIYIYELISFIENIMKILVTGATGFIGNHIIPLLLKRGHEVIAVARTNNKALELPWYSHVKFISYDTHEPSGKNDFDVLGKPDALIHLVWPGLPNYKDLFHFENNLIADYQFIKKLVSQGLKQVLVTGTCFEYGMVNGCLNESLPSSPDNPYALAKDTLRKFLQSLQQETFFTLQWVRLFYMYGEGQNPGSLLAQLEIAIDRGDASFNMSGGEQLRDYLPVESVAQRIVALIEHESLNGIYNCCSGEPISVRKLVEEYIRMKKADITLNLGFYPYPDFEPMAFWGDATKYNSEVNLR